MFRWTLTALLLAPLSAWAADKPDLEKLLEAKTFTEGKAALSYPAPEAGDRRGGQEVSAGHLPARLRRARRRQQGPTEARRRRVRRGGGRSSPASSSPRSARRAERGWGRPPSPARPRRANSFSISSRRRARSFPSTRSGSTSPACRWAATAPGTCWPDKPDLFAAGIPICGGGDPKEADQARQDPDLGVPRRQGRGGQGRTLAGHGRRHREGGRQAQVHRVPRRRP